MLSVAHDDFRTSITLEGELGWTSRLYQSKGLGEISRSRPSFSKRSLTKRAWFGDAFLLRRSLTDPFVVFVVVASLLQRPVRLFAVASLRSLNDRCRRFAPAMSGFVTVLLRSGSCDLIFVTALPLSMISSRYAPLSDRVSTYSLLRTL